MLICLHCNVSSRHISKRSHPPSSVYLPPPIETVATEAAFEVEETSEPVATVKLAETNLVTEAAPEAEAETEVPQEDPEEVVEAETEVPSEDPEEVIEAETEVPAEDPEVGVEAETEIPLEDPEEVIETETEVPAEDPEEVTEGTEAAEEDPIPDLTTEGTADEASEEESAVPEEVLPAIEPVDNLLNPRILDTEEEVIVQTKPVSGYWIEVSGDRDIVVRYQE